MFHFLFIAALSRSWWPTATKLRPRPWPCATSAERIMTREYESLSPQSVSDFWKGCLNQKAIWYSRGDVACTFLWKSYWCITTDFSGEWCEWKPPAVLGSILFSFNQKSNFYFKLLGTSLFLLWSFEHQRHIHDYLDVGKGSIFWTFLSVLLWLFSQCDTNEMTFLFFHKYQHFAASFSPAERKINSSSFSLIFRFTKE